MRRLIPLLLPLLMAGCAEGLPYMGSGGDEDAVARAVEPSLRTAAQMAEANGDWTAAIQHWSTLYQRRPDDRTVAVALARALRCKGTPEQAADLMQASLAKGERDPKVLAEMGKDYLAAERLGLATRALEEAITKAPTDWENHSALGVTLDTQGRHAEAQAAYARALELSPDNPVALNNLALSLAQAGQLNDAIATLRRAMEQPSAGVQLRQNLALLLALKGDSQGAERAAAKDLPPEMVRTNNQIFRTLAERAK
ncbi:MAG TPA: tetratricopeptide repeat protein [Magnetospirillum sp.]|jgi:Flp pilus assembly protein TadD|nr:tetratricopeptide repeat protein [Magnetospirillum sp.]